MNIYDFQVKDAQGNEKTLTDYQGKVVLIVNTASKCGFTPQYQELQKLYDRLHSQGLEVLAFPCDQFGHQEPGSNEEIQQFCQTNYGVTFPVFAKVDVNGKEAHPLFRFLRSQCKGLLNDQIKWNFSKFLIDRSGQVVDRFAPITPPEKLAPVIEKLLAEGTYNGEEQDIAGECV